MRVDRANMALFVPLYILSAVAILCFTWIMIPRIQLMYYTSTIVGFTSLFVCLILVAFYRSPRHLFFVLLLLTLGKCLITFLVPASLDFNMGFLSLIENSIFILSIIISYTVISYQRRSVAIILVTVLILLYYIVYSSTTPVLAEYPNASRDLAGGGDPIQLLIWRMSNVGGFGFAYCSAPIGLFALEIAIKSKKILIKVAAIFFFSNIAVFILLTQYTTLLVFFTVCAIIILHKEFHNKFLTFILGLSILVFILYFQEIMFSISNYTESLGLESVSHHFNDFGGTAQGHALKSKRDDLAINALSLWLKSPIWGNWGISLPTHPSYKEVIASHTGVGGLLATSGLIGFGFMAFFLYTGWKYIHQLLMDKGCTTRVFDLSFLFMIIVWFINPITGFYELQLMVFTFVPLASFGLKKLINTNSHARKKIVRT